MPNKKLFFFSIHEYCVCLGNSDPFHIVTFYIKWVTTSWGAGARALAVQPNL